MSLVIESKALLPESRLPQIVPHFTGRDKECNEILEHLTSEATRLVTVWGSPGFGKTSVAMTVGHRLKAQGLPVYFLSRRGQTLKSHLTSKLRRFFRRSKTFQSDQRLSADDELCSLFDEISDPCTFILDNIDDLFESGMPNVKEEVINLVAEFLDHSNKVTFLLTTRESCEFLNLRFQGHQAVRIRELDEVSSQRLVQNLLPAAGTSECLNVTKICGKVPLAILLCCSSISAYCCGQPSYYLDELMASTDKVVEMLDNSDYPSDLRLKSLFDASFQRLSTQEKEALVVLSIIPENFDIKIAAAVLGMKKFEARKMLEKLQRKSLIDFSLKSEKNVSFHKLLVSFVREKGELEMKETVLNSKARFCEFYIALFQDLTEKFLRGSSMSALIEFFEDEKYIVQSLINGCLNSRNADKVFNALVKAELYLSFLYYCDRAMFDIIYDSALKAVSDNHWKIRLLDSKAFGTVILTFTGETNQLPNGNQIRFPTSVSEREQKGKHLSYYGICQLLNGRIEDGIKLLEEGLSNMVNIPEHTILKLIIFQILSLYHRFKGNTLQSVNYCQRAVDECRKAGDTGMLVMPEPERATNSGDEKNLELGKINCTNAHNQPLQIQVIRLVSQAARNLSAEDINHYFSNLLLKTLKESETALPTATTGSFNYRLTCALMVLALSTSNCYVDCEGLQDLIFGFHSQESFRKEDPKIPGKHMALAHTKSKYSEAVESRKTALDLALELFGEEHPHTAYSYYKLGITQHRIGDFVSALESRKRALDIRIELFGEKHSQTADSFHHVGATQHAMGDFVSALESTKRALDIRIKLFGEEHSQTANSFYNVGTTQHAMGDFVSALKSTKRALDIRIKLFGEEHSQTANSFNSVGTTQRAMGDFVSALESKKRALDISIKLFGEEHSQTADSFNNVGATQHAMGDFVSALESTKRALDIRIKLFGEEHSQTADSFVNVGTTQHAMGDFVSALESKKRALDIRIKLFGEEHSQTANSFNSVGTTQRAMGNFVSALESTKRALDISIKLFGEEHSQTADSFNNVGATQHAMGDFVSALESTKRALDIRIKLFGEEHSQTADTFNNVGNTQHAMGDFVSALESKKRALDIRIKLFGEEHSQTADSFNNVRATQYAMGDFVSALESTKRALDIKIKLFGEEHSQTADSFNNVGTTQYAMGDFVSALESAKRALDIRIKLFGEEHSQTVDSFVNVGTTQHAMGDFVSALESKKRALDIRIKLFGEEHSQTADSFVNVGTTQHAMGDFVSALESKKRAHDIRIKLFGEEHSQTANSFNSVGTTQPAMGDFVSALESTKRALDISIKLFGEEHSQTADSFNNVGATQHAMGDFVSALESTKRALDIRIKLFGEEHSQTADTFNNVGNTQHAMGDFVSALESKKRALDIRSNCLAKSIHRQPIALTM